MAKGKRNARKDEKAARPKPATAIAPDAWPAWRVERKPIEWLKPNPRNVRTHPVAQLTELDISFAEHGAVRPFVANTKGEILAGHGGTDSVSHLHGRGIEVPVIVVDWPEETQRAFMLRDNATALLSGWDKQRLGLELADLSKLPTVDIKRLGFKPAELNRLLPEGIREGFTNPDAEAPPAPIVPVSRAGDIWLLGEHRLMCGDCTIADHVAALLGADKPHLMVTDPPYGVDYDPAWRQETGLNTGGGATGVVENDHRADWREAWELFPGDVAYVWHSGLHASVVQASLEACDFEMRTQIIWDKTRIIIGRGDYHWQHEPAWYAVRKGRTGHWAGDRSQSSFWSIAETTVWSIGHQKSDTGHGTQKPIECMARPLRNNSQVGDLVYEPFSGSGTTILAGEMFRRRVRALEIMPAYVDVAVRRWEEYTKKTALLAAGELEWEAVAAQRAAERASQQAAAA